MARYTKVDGRLWLDRKFNALSERARYLWMFFLTGPDVTSLPGVIVGGIGHFSEILGWSKRKFLQAFGELEELGMVEADFDHRVVWLPNAVAYNQPQSPNVVVSWETHWSLVPECELKSKIWQHLRAAVQAMSEAFRTAFSENIQEPVECDDVTRAPSRPLSGKPSWKPFGKPFGKAFGNQKQKQKQKQKIPDICPVRSGRCPESTGPETGWNSTHSENFTGNDEALVENTGVSEPGEKTYATGAAIDFRPSQGHETRAEHENAENGPLRASNAQVACGGTEEVTPTERSRAELGEHQTLREHGGDSMVGASGKPYDGVDDACNDLSESLSDSLNVASGKPIGERPESLSERLPGCVAHDSETFQLVFQSPNTEAKAETTQTRYASVTKTKKNDADLSRDELSTREVEALDAILDDETIKKIVRRPAQLARDLCNAAPGVDVPLNIARAGGWLRANPTRAKHNGNRFLINWMTRQQDRGGGYVSNGGGEQRLRAPNAYPVQEGTMEDIEAVWRRSGVGEHVIYTSENQPSEEEVDRILKEELMKCGMWDEAKEEVR